MPALWTISAFPDCQFHVFLSHCGEDRSWLVWPLYQLLKTRRILPWLDLHHYPTGTDPYEALRTGILKCRHIVYLVTLSMLDNGRGWAMLEKAYGGMIQGNLQETGLDLCPQALIFLTLKNPSIYHKLDHDVSRRMAIKDYVVPPG